MSESWLEAFRVRSYEADPSGSATLQTICNYLQEAASNSADHLGFSKDQLDGQTWMLSRLVVQMETYPAWRDIVRVETWPSGSERLFGTREFLVLDETGATIGGATSDWLLIDMVRRRPTRIPEEITRMAVPGRERPVPAAHAALSLPEERQFEQHFAVRHSDMDPNGHVNNVSFLDWTLEVLPAAWNRNRVVAGLEIHFKAEVTVGDTVTVIADEDPSTDGAIIRHRLLIAGEDRDVAHAHTRWVTRP
jgi:medium-chain acyl-[acyl-carrier-protein] hydrolase